MNYNQPSVLVILLERHVIRITDEIILFKMDNDEAKGALWTSVKLSK